MAAWGHTQPLMVPTLQAMQRHEDTLAGGQAQWQAGAVTGRRSGRQAAPP
jgi:hypothetical protein